MRPTVEGNENGQENSIEMKHHLHCNQSQQTTVTLNPALHSTASNVTVGFPARGHTCVKGASSSTNGSRKPPALVLTQDSSVTSFISSPVSSSGNAATCTTIMTSSTPSAKSKVTSGTVTFNDYQWDKPVVFPEPLYADDTGSISSRYRNKSGFTHTTSKLIKNSMVFQGNIKHNWIQVR